MDRGHDYETSCSPVAHVKFDRHGNMNNGQRHTVMSLHFACVNRAHLLRMLKGLMANSEDQYPMFNITFIVLLIEIIIFINNKTTSLLEL